MVDTTEINGSFLFKNLTYTLILLGIVSIAAGLVIGISDNPPGIIVLFGGLICWTLAVVHRWQRTRSFVWLTLGAVAGFVVFAVLHNVFYGFGIMAENHPFVKGVFEVLHVISFLVAILVAPAAAVVGLIGIPVSAWKNHHRRPAPATGPEA